MNDINDFIIRDGVLTKYLGTDSEVVIPDGVTGIGLYAFYNRLTLTSITIPSSVTSIEDWAFSDCISLMHITIPIA